MCYYVFYCFLKKGCGNKRGGSGWGWVVDTEPQGVVGNPECGEQGWRAEGRCLNDLWWTGDGSGQALAGVGGRGVVSSLSPKERGRVCVTLHLCFSRIWHSAWHVEDVNICLNE